ncbi:MAG: adenylyltransferase/cytidyltransferase family protein [Lachnospiraceae bacterium]|nr:adenylyltransferase/cytidyltransferase family protein [Lachnospiraceae bacterium]
MIKVITYGTFDLFHQGHYNILKRAKEQGDYLIVGVTGEIYDLERGKLNVQDSLLTRIENVRKTGLADKIIVEEYMGQKISDVVKYDIDKLVIGSDWYGKFDYLNRYCEVVYLERTKNISSTQLREKQKIYNIGIVSDTMEDGEIVLESKYVSGIHVESVFMEDAGQAAEYENKYELAFSTNQMDEFLKDLDIVYVRTKLEQRFGYCQKALSEGKHVICENPCSLDSEQLKVLLNLAEEKKVLFIDNVILAYLRALAQLTWMLNRELIGQLIKIRCCIQVENSNEFGMVDRLTDSILVFQRILGSDYKEITMNPVYDQNHELIYNQIIFHYDNRMGCIEIGCTPGMKNQLEILGTRGRVDLPDEWWNMGYFEASEGAGSKLKRYSFNFEGNGMRYLLHEMLLMIKEGSEVSKKMQPEESLRIVEIQQHILKELQKEKMHFRKEKQSVDEKKEG